MMTRRKFLTALFSLIISIPLVAQTFTLKGRVNDEAGAPLEMATVAVMSQAKVAMTSLRGEYELHLQSEDSVVVQFSMIGFVSKKRVLRKPKGTQTLIVSLKESEQVLGQVSVTEMKRQTSTTAELKTSTIAHAPSTTANAVEELIQTQAGVSSRNELTSQYNVRGGSFDENSVYINQIEVYRPFLVGSGQQEGLSIINPDMVEKIGFSTGGYSAKYGDKMSSALDITYKQVRRFEAAVTASLLGGSAYIGLGNEHLSWLTGIRYKTTASLLSSLDTQGEYDPRFLDFQTYLHYSPNPRWKLELIGNISDNLFRFTPTSRETQFGTLADVKAFKVYFDGWERDQFRTYFGAMSLTRLFGKNTSVKLIASAFSSREREQYDIQAQYWLTQTETSENLAVGTYAQHARNRLQAEVASLRLIGNHKTLHHEYELGLAVKSEHIKAVNVEYEMRDSAGYSVPHTGKDLYMIYSLRASNRLKATRTEAYIQDIFRFATKDEKTRFTLNYGLRMSHWNFNGETLLSPRASLAVMPAFNRNMTFRLATGLYYQSPFFKEILDTTTVRHVTTATLNSRVKSQQSIHFIAAMDYGFKLGGRPFRFTTEAYFKAISRLIPYAVNNVKVVYNPDHTTSGHIMGLDAKLYGEFVPGTDSWLTFSLMSTSMKIGEKKLPLPTDQRFGVNLFFTDYFPGSTRWRMSLRMIYADGLPFSPPHKGPEALLFRASAYRRADIGMSYLLYDGSRSHRPIAKSIWIGIDGLNLLGIKNVNSFYWVTDVIGDQYAVPNYLTGRQLNFKCRIEF